MNNNRLTVYPVSDRSIEETAFSDADLAAGIRERNDHLCGIFYRRYFDRMLAVAQRITRCEQEAQDAVQDAFMSAIKAIDTFHGDSRLGTWLHRIVINASLMRLRNRSHRTLRSSRSLTHESKQSSHSEVIDQVCLREQRRMVRDSLNRLPQSYRDIIHLRDLEERDTAATAGALSCSQANVKTRLHRARRAMRETLPASLV